jgi:hypothetical protein
MGKTILVSTFASFPVSFFHSITKENLTRFDKTKRVGYMKGVGMPTMGKVVLPMSWGLFEQSRTD